MAEYLATQRIPGDVLVPVPLHPARFRQRGYNQSELLAKATARSSGKDLNSRLLAQVSEAGANETIQAAELLTLDTTSLEDVEVMA